MGVQTEKAHAGEFLISEASRTRSRDNIVYAASQTIVPGQLLSVILVGALAAAAIAAAGNTGNGAIGAVTVDANAPLGRYVLTIIEPASNGGAFTLEGPDGVQLDPGKVGVAYNGPINFTLADGATDFAAGDTIEIEVTQDSAVPQHVAWDGSLDVSGVAFDHAVTGVGETADGVAITGDAEVNASLLTYFDGATLSDKVEGRAQLRRLGIKAR